MKRTLLLAALLAGASSLAIAAPRNTDPDWPCEQVKVSDLSVGSFWNGPAIDPATADWQKDTAVASLVGAITQRRLPMDQATQRIVAFAKAAGDKKQQELALVFAGVFNVLNQERRKVIDGLDRFGQRQKVLAANLRQEGEALRSAQTATPPDDAKVADLTQHLLWDQQFFETRRQSLRFACDVATTIEQRLYGLSQAIQQNLG
jgi:Spy/CpxP family protein refolding chaperone